MPRHPTWVTRRLVCDTGHKIQCWISGSDVSSVIDDEAHKAPEGSYQSADRPNSAFRHKQQAIAGLRFVNASFNDCPMPVGNFVMLQQCP